MQNLLSELQEAMQGAEQREKQQAEQAELLRESSIRNQGIVAALRSVIARIADKIAEASTEGTPSQSAGCDSCDKQECVCDGREQVS